MSGLAIRLLGAAALWGALAGAQDYEAPQRSEYGGPAILSRGEGSTLAASQTIGLRPFLSAQGLYASGLANVSTNAQGDLEPQGDFGSILRGGVVGTKRWRSQSLSVMYTGGYIDFPQNRFFNGVEQILNVNYQAQVSRRVTFRARQMGGTSTRPVFQWSFFQIDPQFYFLPDNEIFDNRLLFSTSSADLTVRLSPRWSANLGGDHFLTRRRSSALFGVEGSRARGDVVYRLSRYSTVGVTYNFLNFRFSRGFGGTDLHSAGLVFSRRFGRHWEFSSQVTGARLESLGLNRVEVDPAVRALVGSNFITEAFYRVQYVPQFNGRLSRRIRRGTLSGNFNRSVMPGNGVFLTSRMTAIRGFYSHQHSNRLTFFAGGGWDEMEALIQNLGPYAGYNASGGMAYSLERLMPGLSLNANLSWVQRRLQRSADRPFHREWMIATVGLAWSPAEFPLAFW